MKVYQIIDKRDGAILFEYDRYSTVETFLLYNGSPRFTWREIEKDERSRP